jgi:hypothetical protein
VQLPLRFSAHSHRIGSESGLGGIVHQFTRSAAVQLDQLGLFENMAGLTIFSAHFPHTGRLTTSQDSQVRRLGLADAGSVTPCRHYPVLRSTRLNRTPRKRRVCADRAQNKIEHLFAYAIERRVECTHRENPVIGDSRMIDDNAIRTAICERRLLVLSYNEGSPSNWIVEPYVLFYGRTRQLMLNGYFWASDPSPAYSKGSRDFLVEQIASIEIRAEIFDRPQQEYFDRDWRQVASIVCDVFVPCIPSLW